MNGRSCSLGQVIGATWPLAQPTWVSPMNACLQRAALISLMGLDCMCTSLFVAPPGLLCCEHKELVEWSSRTEKSIEVYLNINTGRGGPGGIKDRPPSILVHDQGVLFQRVPTI